MTRIMFSGDHHFDETRRFAECQRIHGWMVAEAAQQRIDAFVSNGDVYERASTPVERQAVAAWLQHMAEVCPVFVVKGNHDRELDCALMARLRSKHPITVCEDIQRVRVGDVSLTLMAWPSRAGVLRLAQARGIPAEFAAHDALRALFAGIAQQWDDAPCPRVLAGHFMIDGALSSPGQPLLGAPMNIGIEDFAFSGADIVVAAHVHRPQQWTMAELPVIYTGSPYRTAYGETETKQVLLVDGSAGRPLSWQRIDTPCSAMHLVQATWQQNSFDTMALDGQVRDSEIRLRYSVANDDRPQARHAATMLADSWLQAGAKDVQIEEVVQTTASARAPEIARAQTLGDKLALLWDTRQQVPEPSRRQRLITLAHELEGSDP